MITVVYWKWSDPRPMVGTGKPRVYTSEHVNAQLPMLERHMVGPYRVVCVTDDPTGLDSRVEAFPMPSVDGVDVDGPTRFPLCTRKLWMWSREAKVLGQRVLCLDVDTVIVGSMEWVTRRTEPVVLLAHYSAGRWWSGGSAVLMDTGHFPHMWESFDPAKTPLFMKERGIPRTDQGWIDYNIPVADVPKFGSKEVYVAQVNEPLLPGASVVTITTVQKPWMKECLDYYPWVADYYPLAYREVSDASVP